MTSWPPRIDKALRLPREVKRIGWALLLAIAICLLTQAPVLERNLRALPAGAVENGLIDVAEIWSHIGDKTGLSWPGKALADLIRNAESLSWQDIKQLSDTLRDQFQRTANLSPTPTAHTAGPQPGEAPDGPADDLLVPAHSLDIRRDGPSTALETISVDTFMALPSTSETAEDIAPSHLERTATAAPAEILIITPASAGSVSVPPLPVPTQAVPHQPQAPILVAPGTALPTYIGPTSSPRLTLLPGLDPEAGMSPAP